MKTKYVIGLVGLGAALYLLTKKAEAPINVTYKINLPEKVSINDEFDIELEVNNPFDYNITKQFIISYSYEMCNGEEIYNKSVILDANKINIIKILFTPKELGTLYFTVEMK